MIKSRTLRSISSLNESKQTNLLNSKKYRCDCCKDKKHHDYNRQNRLRRESASSKRLSITHRSSTRYASQQNSINIGNTALASSVQNCAIRTKSDSSKKKLSVILETSLVVEQQKKEDKNTSQKGKNVDMKSYCKNLFQGSRRRRAINRIEVCLKGEKFVIEFDEGEKMKLAIGELKLLIQKAEEQEKRNKKVVE